MSDIPEERTEEPPPFTYVGVDYFGPFIIKERRKELKRWGVIFTCLNSRAIHIETAASLDTSSFINALRRFQGLRGPIRVLRSDQGTNFIGAHNEFKEEWKKLNINNVKEYLASKNCDFDVYEFKPNPPHASNFGGCWERQIRTVRSVLNGLLCTIGHRFDDEGLRTLLTEVASIVNSRPIAVESLADHSCLPLTPNMLLTAKSRVLMPPPGQFISKDIYAVKRWRRVQEAANQFWDRWRKEYLNQLQNRPKWKKPRKNLEVGNLVMVEDDGPRGSWKIGRIASTKLSADNLVRSCTVTLGDRNLSKDGKRVQDLKLLERPCNKLVLLMET
jgi:hypothetical protein